MSAKDPGSILIGGAEGHLGMEAVAAFARRGLTVAASCRTEADERRVAAFVDKERLRGVTTIVCDLSDEAQVQRLVTTAERALGGRIDALLNCAGGFRWAKTTDLSLADYDFLLNANLRSSFLLAKHVLPKMRARDFGRLVFISSRAASAPGEVGMGVYTAAKAALNALVSSLAAELKDSAIRVNAVAPSVIDTPTNRRDMPDADASRWVTTSQLLDMIWVLLSAQSTAVNGAIVPVAGGV